MADDEVVETTQPAPVMLKGLAEKEKMVNEYAKRGYPEMGIPALCKRYGLSPNHFEIRLSTSLEKGHMSLIPGNPVEIILLWPHCQPIINTQLASAFNAIQRHRMWRTMALVPASYMHEGRKWAKVALGDAADNVMDLIPRPRLRMTTTTITTLTDAKTGESISVTHKGKEERYDAEHVGMWLELSRIVREKHPEMLPESNPYIVPAVPVSDAPALDEALAMKIEGQV